MPSYYLDLPVDDDTVLEPGDILRCPRVDHELVEVTPVQSKVWPNRWRCVAVSLGPHNNAPPPEDRRCIAAYDYRTGERPADRFVDH
jgi:hypothetical protein